MRMMVMTILKTNLVKMEIIMKMLLFMLISVFFSQIKNIWKHIMLDICVSSGNNSIGISAYLSSMKASSLVMTSL